MTAAFLLDAVLTLLVLGVAVWITVARDLFGATVGFVAYGLLLAIVWVRLAAVDVALTEAAIGGGATGVLLLLAASRLREDSPAPTAPGARILARILCLAVTAALVVVVVRFTDPGPLVVPSLAPEAVAGLPGLGVGNAVTAVLVAYRGIDTLLEKFVLLLAVAGIWSLTPEGLWGIRPAPWGRGRADPSLVLLARLLVPAGVLVGIYIVWAGADGPGGAFQGGTILAAMWLLTMMAGLMPIPEPTRGWLRQLLVAGPAVFLVVALAGFALSSGFLTYPPGAAKWLIKLIEAALTLSIAAMIVVLVAGPASRRE